MAGRQLNPHASCVHPGGEGLMVNASEGSWPPVWGGPEKVTSDASGVRPGGEDMRAADVPAGNQPPVRGHPETATGTSFPRLGLKGGAKYTNTVRKRLVNFAPPIDPPAAVGGRGRNPRSHVNLRQNRIQNRLQMTNAEKNGYLQGLYPFK